MDARDIDLLARFVRFRSVSALASHAPDRLACARWLSEELARIGLKKTMLLGGQDSPVVYAEWQQAPGMPTLLVYGHYDVQPASMADGWRTDPFTPVVRDGYLYGRGASDDKGQIIAHLSGLRRLFEQTGQLPVNVKCLFDGGEETGSGALLELMASRKDLIKADCALVSDTAMTSVTQPAITVSLRGALGYDLMVQTGTRELHSGTHGGAACDAAKILCAVMGRLTRVERPAPGAAARSPNCAGVHPAHQTTLTINGLHAGAVGASRKSVVPHLARAALDVRLAPGTQPKEIDRVIRATARQAVPKGVAYVLRQRVNIAPVEVARTSGLFRAAHAACIAVFKRVPTLVGSGGSVPVVSALENIYRVPVTMLGFALPDDNAHGPNERFSLAVLSKASLTSSAVLEALAANKR